MNRRVVFAGTPEFAARALSALLAAGFEVPLVLTQPDRPSGRGMHATASAVKQVALAHGVEVLQPLSLKQDAAAVARLKAAPHDVMVVAAYGLILPRAVLDIPAFGCLNIHASLLPRWRGAAPIQRAIEAGDAATGVCIMQMQEGLDTGAVLLRKVVAIGNADTAQTLHDRMAEIGARLIVDALNRLDQLTPVAQPAEGVTYAAKITKSEAALDFRQPAAALARKLRAFDPQPGCSTILNGAAVKLWAGEALPPTVSLVVLADSRAPAPCVASTPGTVLRADANGVVIACGEGFLNLTQLQKPGGKRLTAREFLPGFPLQPGMVCGA